MTPDTPDLSHLLVRVPGWHGRTRVVGALGGGMTNRNVLVDVDGERFVVRLAGRDTELLEIRRDVEFEAAARAAALGIGPEVVAFIEPEQVLVTRFVVGAPVDSVAFSAPASIAAVSEILRRLHDSGRLSRAFDAFTVPHRHRDSASSRGVAIPEAFRRAAEIGTRIGAAFASSPEPVKPCHNDLLNANFLSGPDRLWLLDWEYAGNNDRYFDLGNLAVNNDFDRATRDQLVGAYFGAPSRRRSARLELMMIMSDFREAMWGVVQQGISDIDFDYVAYATRHFERMLVAGTRSDFVDLLDAAASGSPDA